MALKYIKLYITEVLRCTKTPTEKQISHVHRRTADFSSGVCNIAIFGYQLSNDKVFKSIKRYVVLHIFHLFKMPSSPIWTRIVIFTIGSFIIYFFFSNHLLLLSFPHYYLLGNIYLHHPGN